MYKIIHNSKVIDVVRYPNFIKFLPSGHIAATDKSSAQGIVGSDRSTPYSFKPISNRDCLVVSIAEIATEEEFKRLESLLNSRQEIEADDSALSKAKTSKLKDLSNQCKNNIISGCTIKLSDGNTYKFKFTLEDQVNLMLIENQLISGSTSAIYHATDQPCRFFEREDMLKIINAFKQLNLYHTTYFNIAKQYINSLTDIEKINLFLYGTDVSGATDDMVLKQILRKGSNVE